MGHIKSSQNRLFFDNRTLVFSAPFSVASVPTEAVDQNKILSNKN